MLNYAFNTLKAALAATEKKELLTCSFYSVNTCKRHLWNITQQLNLEAILKYFDL